MTIRLISVALVSLVTIAWTSTPLADGGVGGGDGGTSSPRNVYPAPPPSAPPSLAPAPLMPSVGDWAGGARMACPTADILAGAGSRPVKLPAGCSLPEPGYWRAIGVEAEIAANAAGLQAEVETYRAEVVRLRQQLLLGADALHDCGSYIDLARLQCPPCECHTWSAAGAACAACAGLSAGAAAVLMSN